MELDSKAGNYHRLLASFRWQTPVQFNIAQACCGRWASDRSRFALYCEDTAGATQAWSFWDIQRTANRLSNVLGALGTLRGERVAMILPQRPEAAIALVACSQMGAIAVPLSPQSAGNRLESLLNHAAARIAIVDSAALPGLAAIGDRLPHLRHIIGVGGKVAPAGGVHDWTRLLEYASPRYAPLATSADDPALILYAGESAGDPQGVLLAQRTVLGSLPGFVCAHDFYPQPGDMFWSPADWTDAPGLFGALLPAWYFGQPVLCQAGGFDPEKAYALLVKFAVRNLLLLPGQLKSMIQAVPKPRDKYGIDLNLRSLASGGDRHDKMLDEASMQWVREQLGVTVNQVVDQAGFSAVVGGCHTIYPPRPGAMGRTYPGHQVAILDRGGQPLPAGETGEICLQRLCNGEADPLFPLEYWQDPDATHSRFGGVGNAAWQRTGILARCDEDGYFWYQGAAGRSA